MTEKNISILIIDDEPSILQSLQGILIDEGYKVFLAESGQKGLDILQSRKIDVVILDHWMPDMNGVETLEKIKEKSPEVNVILTSDHGSKELVTNAIKLGASDLLEKPLLLETLLPSIGKSIKRKEKKVFRVLPGEKITARFYESICLYSETSEMVEYLENFCRERFFKAVIATNWTDILACPCFVAIIDPSIVKKREWSILFDYLSQVPDAKERYVLLSKTLQPKIPKNLRRFFKTTKDRDELEQYMLYRNKKTLKRMMLHHKVRFLSQRKEDVKMILNKTGLQREFFIGKLAKYYNISTSTIQRDLAKIRQ